ncbi:4Fe-4S binding protein [Oleidesulfovibrio sp.]|uniref:4Fe-4S binding protein n=1 Tax=Oleidesulfovibrio sp. TaxID=2909707 RepID=UPI003A854DD8
MSDFASDTVVTTACRSAQGLNCRFGLFMPHNFLARVQGVITDSGWDGFLKDNLRGPVRQHHAFKVAVSGCPNGCARPHIADVGIIRVCRPQVDVSLCSGCGRCAAACPDAAITMSEDIPQFDRALCIDCGQCLMRCPEQALFCDPEGFKVVMGGQLGRHPRLATQVGGIVDDKTALCMLARAMEFYMQHYRNGLRFGALLRERQQELEAYVQHSCG